MSKNKVRLFFKLSDRAEHVYMNIFQMFPEKSVYLTSLLKKEKIYIGYVSDKNSITILDRVPVQDQPKISIHTSEKIHVKTANNNKKIIEYRIPQIEKLNYPQEICTIFSANPLSYPLRNSKGKLDTEIDLSDITKGVFGLKIYLVKPCKPERKINSLLTPFDKRFPIGSKITTTYKTYKEFAFFISYYQTPKLTSYSYDKNELWIFTKPKDTEKQSTSTIIEDRIFEINGKKIEISKPKIELNKLDKGRKKDE